MSLWKNVPPAPVTEPAAEINNCDVPARCVVNCACAGGATRKRKTHKLRLMRNSVLSSQFSVLRSQADNRELRTRNQLVFAILLFTATSLHAKEIVIRAARILDGRGHEARQAAVVVNDSKIVRIDLH